jgi:hypothetical protein
VELHILKTANSLALSLGEDGSDSYDDAAHPEGIAQEVSCFRTGGANALSCAHTFGKWFGTHTDLGAVVDASSENAIIQWERLSSGESFP